MSSIIDMSRDVPKCVDLDLVEETAVIKRISGLFYYGVGSTFLLDFKCIYIFNNVYNYSIEPVIFEDGATVWGIPTTPVSIRDSHVTGVTQYPKTNEVMVVSDYQLVVPADQDERSAKIYCTPINPNGSFTSVATPDYEYMIMSWGNVGTMTVEYFRDERYRFDTSRDFDVVPISFVGNWDSEVLLTSGQAGYTDALQQYDPDAIIPNALVYPTVDYTTCRPIGSPDYKRLWADLNRRYSRVFVGSVDHNSGVLSVPGITDADLSGGSPYVKIEIKVPTKTMWLNVWTDYNGGVFSTAAAYPAGADSTGCRINKKDHSPSLDGTIEFTLGSYVCDASVSRCLFVRVTYKDYSVPNKLNGSGVGFGITNW
jgi:hypothetical protein